MLKTAVGFIDSDDRYGIDLQYLALNSKFLGVSVGQKRIWHGPMRVQFPLYINLWTRNQFEFDVTKFPVYINLWTRSQFDLPLSDEPESISPHWKVQFLQFFTKFNRFSTVIMICICLIISHITYHVSLFVRCAPFIRYWKKVHHVSLVSIWY